jgi:hypothetical protein
MKNLFFQKGILVSLLFIGFQTFGQNSVVLTYPLNNSVFQQSSSGNTPVSFAGQVLKGSYLSSSMLNNNAYLQLEKYNYSSKSWGYHDGQILGFNDCTNCNNSLEFDPKSFYLKGGTGIATLSAGWYRATIVNRLPCQTNSNLYLVKPLSSAITFGVGDVYIIAGQSNASGFTRQFDGNLMYYESTNFDGLPKITDAEIPEGSIINRILTDNRFDILRQVGGLSMIRGLGADLQKTLLLQKAIQYCFLIQQSPTQV